MESQPSTGTRYSNWNHQRRFRHFRPIVRNSQEPVYVQPSRTTTPIKASKRGQYEAFSEPDYVENVLVQLCRAKDWSGVIQRCCSHPDEAVPHKLTDEHRYNKYGSNVPKVGQNMNFNNDRSLIYHHTALGIACASKDLHTEEVCAVVRALVRACPEQVNCSQLVSGHTPLRDALKNIHCDIEILKMLMNADFNVQSFGNGGKAAIYQKDRDGLYPIDHLIIGVQLGSPKHSLDLLKEFVKAKTAVDTSNKYKDFDVSPLIRLLTLGTAFGIESPIFSSPWNQGTADESRLSRIFECTKHLLSDSPSLIYKCSRATGCSPLHIALRNYGNYIPLTRELIKRDINNTNIRVRNNYRDLPLHVACSAGVPIDVLRLVLERTISAASSSDSWNEVYGSPHPLIWSVNHSGYTPIDLEWVRHIESGKSLYAARAFFPLEVTGIRKHCDRQNEYYRDLLDEAVLQVLERPRFSCLETKEEDEEDTLLCREEEAKKTFGILVDRLGLLVLAASSYSCQPSKNPLSFQLHAASSLSFPHGPTLPLPVLELFLWLHPEQLLEHDHNGRLPIHCALDRHKILSTQQAAASRSWKDWKIFVTKVLQSAPQSSEVTDKIGRLPLHIVLDSKRRGSVDSLRTSKEEESQSSLGEVIKNLVKSFPASVDTRDPVTNLYPFMLAATSPSVPLDSIFFLLRRSPSRCCTGG